MKYLHISERAPLFTQRLKGSWKLSIQSRAETLASKLQRQPVPLFSMYLLRHTIQRAGSQKRR
jgi:hypothetical protein